MRQKIQRLLTVAFCLCILQTNAQQTTNWKVEIGLNAGLSTENTFGLVTGGDVRLQKAISKKIAVTLTSGFTHFFEKDKVFFTDHSGYGSPYNVIPVKAGLKLFATPHLYIAAEAGAGFGFEEWKNSFVWSPSVGVAFRDVDVSAKYESYTRNDIGNQLAVRVAYGFNVRSKLQAKRVGNHNQQLYKKWAMQLGLNGGANFGGSLRPAIGADIRVQRKITDRWAAAFTAGYTHFLDAGYGNVTPLIIDGVPQNLEGYENTYRFIPIKAVVQFFPSKIFYVGADAGIGLEGNGGSSFVWSPSLGLALKRGLDIGLKYESFTQYKNANQFALRVGYRIFIRGCLKSLNQPLYSGR